MRRDKPSEIERFLQSADEIEWFCFSARSEGDAVHILYATAVYTGMRTTELTALLWRDVDLDRNVIRVRESPYGSGKGRYRRVPIHRTLRPRLSEWSKIRPHEEYVFVNSHGMPLQPTDPVFVRVLHRVLDAASFPKVTTGRTTLYYIRFHDLRHTFAAHYMMSGGHIRKLQKILGHSSPRMTERYAFLSPSALADAGDHFSSANCALMSDAGVQGSEAASPIDDRVLAEIARAGTRPRSSHCNPGSSLSAASPHGRRMS